MPQGTPFFAFNWRREISENRRRGISEVKEQVTRIMGKAENAENRGFENTYDWDEVPQRLYYPVVQNVRVLKSRLDQAVYLEIRGMSRPFQGGRGWEFCTCYMAETQNQLKRLIRKHVGAGSEVSVPQFPVKRAEEDFDCMIGNTRTSWACLQGYLIKKLERDDPHEELEWMFREEGIGRIFKVLRRDIIKFTDLDNMHRPEPSYGHNSFMKRIQGFVTQLFPYLPERYQRDEGSVLCLLMSALRGDKLSEEMYYDTGLWRELTDMKNICSSEDAFLRSQEGRYEVMFLKSFLATHFPHVKEEVKEKLGNEAIITLIRKGVLHSYDYGKNEWRLPGDMEVDPEVVFEAVRAGFCSYGFPLPGYVRSNDDIVAEHIMTLHMRKLNEGYLYETYDYPAAAQLVRDYEVQLRCLSEDRGRGETVQELAELVIRVYERNHHYQRKLRDLGTPMVDAAILENEALKEKIRELESSLREKEKLEDAISLRNRQLLDSFMTDILSLTAVQGRIVGGQGEGSVKELCLCCEGCVFYFSLDFLNPGMMEKLGADIRVRAGEAREDAVRKLLAAADACDHKGFYETFVERARSYVAEQNQKLQAVPVEERKPVYPDSGLSL